MTDQGRALPALTRPAGTVHAGTVPGTDPQWAVRPGEGAERGDVQPTEPPRPRLRAKITPELLLLTAERLEQIAGELDGPEGAADPAARLRACAQDLRDGVREIH